MTLIPEPREVRTLRRPAGYGSTLTARSFVEASERAFQAATGTQLAVDRAFAEIGDRIGDLREPAEAATRAIAALPTLSRRQKRRICKDARLRDHHAAKLARIPAWKRASR